jgi:helix-turn-helix protein
MFKPGSQNDLLLKHLLSGKTITRYEAMLMFRVQNITARMSDLYKAGYDVKTTIRTDPNGQTYAKYSL